MPTENAHSFDSATWTRRSFLTTSMTASAALAAAGTGIGIARAQPDPIRRGADSLVRFYQSKDLVRPEQIAAARVRPFMSEARTDSLRTLITNSVVTFVPPQMPIGYNGVLGTHVLAALQSSGGFHLGVRIEALSSEPAVFLVGFCTNDSRGAWTVCFGAVNYDVDSVATSRGRVGVFSTRGASSWLKHNFAAVRSTGLTFRMVSSRDPARTPMRPFLGSFFREFQGRLKHENLLALTDEAYDRQSFPNLPDAEATTSLDPDENTLQGRVRLVFE